MTLSIAVKRGAVQKIDVSVIIANYNSEKFIEQAIRSACDQTHRNIEIVVSDDASTDSSVRIVEGLAAKDDRIRLIRSPINGGAAAARNRALEVAQGQWISILDADDLMHPNRIRVLLNDLSESGADIIADDLLLFDSDRQSAPRTLFKGRKAKVADWVTASEYVATNNFFGRGPALGYLKPMFRASMIEKMSLRYDERLTIAEDFNFVFRLLIAGAKFRTIPEIGYFYRRHSASISHRLSSDVLQQILDVESDWIARCFQPQLQSLLRSREKSIRRAIRFDELVLAIKAKRLVKAAVTAITNPGAAWLLRLPVAQFINRLRRSPKSSKSERRQICILSRQRIVGRTNGSSRYLLGITSFLVERGFDVHLIVPSPSTMGRWPFLKLSSDMDGFASIRCRGTVRLGRYIIVCNPAVFARSALALLDRFMYRQGLTARPLTKPAPYAIAQPLIRNDQKFVARLAPSIADVLIADYCFLTEAFPFALRPDAKRIVIMHDLFSSRSSQFAGLNQVDSVTSLSLSEEVEMLAVADTIVAIQQDEAAVLRKELPNHEVVVAPVAALPVAFPQAGAGDIVLFVGSSTAPNVDGIKWFIESSWSLIQRSRPDASLYIAGSVCDALGQLTGSIKLLNVVEDLEDLYAAASVVISPLRAGSGLKIKLIEALSKGKAMVVTSATMQGVDDLLAGCVRVTDSAEEFASSVIDLLAHESSRAELGSNGIAAVARNFSPERAYNGISAAAERPRSREFADTRM